MNITHTIFCNSCLLFLCNIVSPNTEKLQIESREQITQTAIQDFSKTKLYEMDSVFHISFYDTVYRMELKKITESEYKWVYGSVYPDIIAMKIIAYPNKFFLDTTIDVRDQNNTIPSQCIERNGKLFFWYDEHYLLTNNAIKMLDKYHRIWRGGPSNSEDHPFVIDDSMKETDYYFCRGNSHIYKKEISNKPIGYYEPPNIIFKPK